MNKEKARDPLTQRILDLTLEIIFLLTGEDHMVVKIHEMVTDNSRHQISEGGHCRTQSFNTESPPHSGIHGQNHEKILELTNKIIRLLTGEVPIRCEDVTVYLSVEEWEYMERHKEIYKDVMMENHQPIVTLDTVVPDEVHTPMYYSGFGTGNRTSCRKKHLNKRVESVSSPEEEPLAFDKRYVPEKDLYPTMEYTEHSPTAIKEEPDSSEEKENLPDAHTNKHTSTCTRAESDSLGEGDKQSHPDIYPSPGHAQHEYPSAGVKKESPTYEKGNLTDTDRYKLPEDTQTERPPDGTVDYLKATSNLLEINHSRSLMESRKPDQSIYFPTDIKEEPDSNEEENLYKPMEQKQYTSSFIGAETGSHGEISHPGIYPSLDHTKTEYPSNDIKKESPIYEKGNFTDIYKPPEDTKTERPPDNIVEYLKATSNPLEINHSESLIESRNPDQSVCYTGFIMYDSVYDGNSASPSEMGKVSYSLSDLAICVKNARGEPFLSNLGGTNSTTGSAHKHHHAHNEEQPFSCLECGKPFTDNIALNKHRRTHTGKKQFKCPECGKCFTKASNLTAHKKTHTGEKLFQCTECGKCLTRASNLARHKIIHTGEKSFKCAECGNFFADATSLARHKVIHTGEKPFKCTVCGKCFTQASSLKTHKILHTGKKPYNCTECGKGFTKAARLTAHKRSHTGEKLFNCNVCGKSLTRASHLAKHKILHTAERTFQCNECGKCLTRASHLARHKIIHTGEKPFKCAECGNFFADATSLARHKVIHTGEKPFKCSACGKCFPQCSSLSRHRLIHTGEKNI